MKGQPMIIFRDKNGKEHPATQAITDIAKCVIAMEKILDYHLHGVRSRPALAEMRTRAKALKRVFKDD